MKSVSCRWLLRARLLLAAPLLALNPLASAQETDGRPAGEWLITPRLSTGITYSDNIRLAPADQAEGDWVLQVDPGVSVRKQGGGLNLRLDYTAQMLLYTQSGESQVNNDLIAFANAELYPEHLFVDVYGSIAQVPTNSTGRVDAGNLGLSGGSSFLSLFNNIDLGLPGSREIFNPIGIFSNLALTDDQTTAANFGISPYWQQNFGGWAEGTLRYRYDDTAFDQGDASDGRNQTVTLDLNSGRRFSQLSWSLSAFYQAQDLNGNDAGDAGNSTERSIDAQARYRLNPRWSLLAEAGYVNNDLATFADNRNGSYWAAGFGWTPSRFIGLDALYGVNLNQVALRWTPSARTRFEVQRRDQDIGASPGVHWEGSADYRSRFSIWTLRYTEEVTSVQQLLANGLTGVGPDGQPIALDDTQQIAAGGGPFGLNNDQFLRKRLDASVAYQRGRNGLLFNAFNEDRSYTTPDSSDENAWGAGGLWTWRFAPRTASFLGTGWEHDDTGDEQQNDYWVSVIGLARVFTPDAGALISYRYYQNDADPSDQSFRENRLNLRFSMKF